MEKLGIRFFFHILIVIIMCSCNSSNSMYDSQFSEVSEKILTSAIGDNDVPEMAIAPEEKALITQMVQEACESRHIEDFFGLYRQKKRLEYIGEINGYEWLELPYIREDFAELISGLESGDFPGQSSTACLLPFAYAGEPSWLVIDMLTGKIIDLSYHESKILYNDVAEYFSKLHEGLKSGRLGFNRVTKRIEKR